MSSKNTPILIIAASEHDANLYYVTKFLAPDPFVYIQTETEKIIITSDLEIDRAKQESSAKIYSLQKLYQNYTNKPELTTVIADVLKEKGIDQVQVPQNFPILYADELRNQNITVTPKKDPFLKEREIKTNKEINHIQDAIIAIEKTFDKVITILKAATIQNDTVYYNNKPLTCEFIKEVISTSLLQQHFIASHTIVACGKDGVDPHNEGNGPIQAHTPIIIDIFPKSTETGYFGDFTRTVVKGKASPELQKQYAAVKQAQDIAFAKIKDGVNGKDIHNAILTYFQSNGFTTGKKNGRMQGFFHGTGHGLGLEIHEYPRINQYDCILQTGHVVTIEPGLYYTKTGGIRLEDVVIITKSGCKNLTTAPKILEIN